MKKLSMDVIFLSNTVISLILYQLLFALVNWFGGNYLILLLTLPVHLLIASVITYYFSE